MFLYLRITGIAHKETEMNEFMDFAKSETAALKPTLWDKWFADVEKRVGHSLDGDQKKDGYSIDFLGDWFDEGLSSESAAARVKQALA